jgi:hypothetical protein
VLQLARRTARERPTRPLQGYKLAFPMLSADGSEAGFSGVTLGRTHVYGASSDAVCAYRMRHSSPGGWCECGFYCFNQAADAWALACEAQYRNTVLLEVTASGKYMRYERGLRYARQRIRAVRLGRCTCGRAAQFLLDAGSGTVGWRQLMPSCIACVGTYPALTPAMFGKLAGGIPVTGDDAPSMPQPAPLPGEDQFDSDALVPLLSAEVTLLQARLDDVQARLERLTRSR